MFQASKEVTPAQAEHPVIQRRQTPLHGKTEMYCNKHQVVMGCSVRTDAVLCSVCHVMLCFCHAAIMWRCAMLFHRRITCCNVPAQTILCAVLLASLPLFALRCAVLSRVMSSHAELLFMATIHLVLRNWPCCAVSFYVV